MSIFSAVVKTTPVYIALEPVRMYQETQRLFPKICNGKQRRSMSGVCWLLSIHYFDQLQLWWQREFVGCFSSFAEFLLAINCASVYLRTGYEGSYYNELRSAVRIQSFSTTWGIMFSFPPVKFFSPGAGKFALSPSVVALQCAVLKLSFHTTDVSSEPQSPIRVIEPFVNYAHGLSILFICCPSYTLESQWAHRTRHVW